MESVVSIGQVEKAYGLSIQLSSTNIQRIIEDIESTKATVKAEVVVTLDEEVHTFTFEEFFDRLGFTPTVDG